MPHPPQPLSYNLKHLTTRMFLFLCVVLCVFVVWGGEARSVDNFALTPEQQLAAHLRSLSNTGVQHTKKCLISTAAEGSYLPNRQEVVTCFPLAGTHESWNINTYSVARGKVDGAQHGSCGSTRNHCALDFYPAEDTTPGGGGDDSTTANYNQAIYSVWTGKVDYKGKTGDCGKSFRITSKPEQTGFSNDNITIEYCHIDEYSTSVSQNDIIAAGTYLGTTGASGDTDYHWRDSSGSHLHIRFVRNYVGDWNKRERSIPEHQLVQWPIFRKYNPENGSVRDHLHYCGYKSFVHYNQDTRNEQCNTYLKNSYRTVVSWGGFERVAGPTITRLTRCSDGTTVTPPERCPIGTTVISPPPPITTPTSVKELLEDPNKYFDGIERGGQIIEEQAPPLKPCSEAGDDEECLCDCTDNNNCLCPVGKAKKKNTDDKWVCSNQQLKLQVDWMPLPLDGQSIDAVSSPGEVVTYLFRLLLYIGVILAFLSLLVTGMMYMVSSAAPDLRRQALSRVKKIFTGLIILLLSYIILGFITPSITQTGIPSLSEQGEQDECSIETREPTAIPPRSHTDGFEDVGQYEVMSIGRMIRDFYVTMQVERGECTEAKIDNLINKKQLLSYRENGGISTIRSALTSALPSIKNIENLTYEELETLKEDTKKQIAQNLYGTDDGDAANPWIEFAEKCGNLPYVLGGLKREHGTNENDREPDMWGRDPSSNLLNDVKTTIDGTDYSGIRHLMTDPNMCGIQHCRPPSQVTCKSPQPEALCREDTVCEKDDDGKSICTKVEVSCNECGFTNTANCCPNVTVTTTGAHDNTCSGNVFGIDNDEINSLIDKIEEYDVNKDIVEIATTMEKVRKDARECERNNGILYTCASLQIETGSVDEYNCDKLYIKDKDSGSSTGAKIGNFLTPFADPFPESGDSEEFNLYGLSFDDLENELHFFCGNAENGHIYTQGKLPIGKLTLGPVFNDENNSIILRETSPAEDVEEDNKLFEHLSNIRYLLNRIENRTCKNTETNLCSNEYGNQCTQPTPQCRDAAESKDACHPEASLILDSFTDFLWEQQSLLGIGGDKNKPLTYYLDEYQQSILQIRYGLRKVVDEIQNDEIAARATALIFSTNREIEDYLQDQCGEENEECHLNDTETQEKIQEKLEKLDSELPYIVDILTKSQYVDPARTCVEMKQYIQELEEAGRYKDGKCTQDVMCCPSERLKNKLDACEPMDLFKCTAQ